MASMASAAIADAGLASNTPIDAIYVTPPLAWGYHDLPTEICSASGIRAHDKVLMDPGGSAPVDALLSACERIAAGEIDVALVVGGESMYSRRRAKREGLELTWTPFTGHRDLVGNQRPLANDLEYRHFLRAPRQLFPLLENALRAQRGSSMEQQRLRMSSLLSANSKVAKDNRYAWFARERSAEEIADITADNRMICFPYTKLMNAVMEVDQAGALVVSSTDYADRRQVPTAARSVVVGGAMANDAWTPSERPFLASSPALHAVAGALFELSGLQAEQVDYWDLYSCFPVAIQFAAEAFGLPEDGSRELTVTGGLAYAGGPGSSYCIHSMAAMHSLIAGTNAHGIATGLGNVATKHAAVLLAGPMSSSGNRATQVLRPTLPPGDLQGPPLIHQPSGAGFIETYTVEMDRNGQPVSAPIIVRLDAGQRSIALLQRPSDIDVVLTSEGIGRRVDISPGDADSPNTAVLTGD